MLDHNRQMRRRRISRLPQSVFFADWESAFQTVSKTLDQWGGSIEEFVSWLDKSEIPYLSYSKISTFDSCEYRYLMEYVQHIKLAEQPPYFVKGNAFHAAAGIAYRQMAEGIADIVKLQAWVKKHCSDHHLHVTNALHLLVEHAHKGYKLVDIEHPFVLSLGPGLPPLVGVIDLLLQKGRTFVIVDHKTGTNFCDQDDFQLQLYRRYVRTKFNARRCLACFDEYRWVNSLERIRKPAFRRSYAQFASQSWSQSLQRIRHIYENMCRVERTGDAGSGGNCYTCPFKNACDRALTGWW
jgi:hypothetical protein